MRAKLEQERQELLDEAERVRQQRLQLQVEEKAMLEEARRKRKEIQQEMERYRFLLKIVIILKLATKIMLPYNSTNITQ